MLIRHGYDITIEGDGPLPMLLQMSVRPERQMDLRGIEDFATDPAVGYASFTDGFGNACRRLQAPPGRFRLRQTAVIADSGLPEPGFPEGQEMPVSALPDAVLPFLMPSRYCDSDLLLGPACELFGHLPPGWSRVQAIMDWVHGHMRFDYQQADATRTARDALRGGVGVCRDFAHLAIAMCRALNIPARYVNSYLGNFGVPPSVDPMDFAASVQVWLSNRWWGFDPRNNQRRIGRLPVGYGRDAADVALISSFGQHRLIAFTIITEEVEGDGTPLA